MKDVFYSDCSKDYTAKMLIHIKDEDSVKDDSIETILPGVLRKMDDTNEAITEVQKTLLQHKSTTNIKCIEKTVHETVDKVIGKKLKKFAVHIGNFNEDESDAGEETNSISLQTTDDTVMRNNVQVSHPDKSVYTLPEFFPTVGGMLEHWDEYLEENERKYKARWRKHWSNSEKKRFNRIKGIVHTVKKYIIDSGNHSVLGEIEKYYKVKKSIAGLCTKLNPKNNYIINICYFMYLLL